MEIDLILMLLIAHLFSDFIFQTQRMSRKKESTVFTLSHLYHFLIVALTSFLLSLDIHFWFAAILLSLTHLGIDIIKSWLIVNYKKYNYFFFDQFIHLLTIIIVVLVYSNTTTINFLFQLDTKTIATIAGFVFCAKPANIFIKHIFLLFNIQTPLENSENPEEISLPNAGKLIGIVERFLALALIILGQYEAVGLIIAAKSILRFNGTQKSEYVLVGTLLSFSFAAFIGIFIALIK